MKAKEQLELDSMKQFKLNRKSKEILNNRKQRPIHERF